MGQKVIREDWQPLSVPVAEKFDCLERWEKAVLFNRQIDPPTRWRPLASGVALDDHWMSFIPLAQASLGGDALLSAAF